MARFDPAAPLVHPLPDPDRVELRPGLAYAEAGFDAVVAEVGAALAAVRDRAGDLGLDPDRQALAAFSAGVPLAAAALTGPGTAVRCAALCYGPLDDLAPGPGLPPLLVVRAGRDHPQLNRTIDRFLAAAEAGGPPVELVDLPDAHHAFDTVDDTDASRDAIRRILGFLRAHLAA